MYIVIFDDVYIDGYFSYMDCVLPFVNCAPLTLGLNINACLPLWFSKVRKRTSDLRNQEVKSYVNAA